MAHGSGPTRARLEGVLGLPKETQVRNLVWPDNRPGTWDADEARLSANHLREWLKDDGHLVDGWDEPPSREKVAGVVLLGRRVAEAWFADWDPRTTCLLPWGGIYREAGLPPTILLPHPSGRSTTLNDPSVSETLRSVVREFLKETALNATTSPA